MANTGEDVQIQLDPDQKVAKDKRAAARKRLPSSEEDDVSSYDDDDDVGVGKKRSHKQLQQMCEAEDESDGDIRGAQMNRARNNKRAKLDESAGEDDQGQGAG